jgi:RNA recognition motif-containing protein
LSLCSAKIIMDHEIGRSRGFGFVTYNLAEEARSAITGMDWKVCHFLFFIPFALGMSDAALCVEFLYVTLASANIDWYVWS